ncbi:unnamed protein product [Onchocerca ochengi]|uniref:Shootin-1 n=1 Tax=Onchocerca ochengi TaxID=42157 RepID=A0A182DY05_ONCOC|nr:unnamed protein product [Onchocerca ochengi]
MTSSTSTRSTFSGLSEGCMSEAGSSGLQNRNSAEESQEDCPKCAAMRLNTVIAEEALASLSGQFKNLQKELKKTEQVSKINEEQAKYIDERRSKLEKLEAEHTSLYAEYENLRINHDSLKRQYDEVIATARRNQRLIEESVKYHETCKAAMENLMAEKEARQELLAKYLKSVEAAAKINDSMKQLEKKCFQLQSINEKLEPFKYHCPILLRLLLEFGEIVENNGLMTKSLQKRLARYKDRDDLREYLLRKTRRMTDLSESNTGTIEESSEDDELAKGVEDLLLRIDSPSRLKSPKKPLSPKKKIKNTEKNDDHSTNSMKEILNMKAAEKGNFLKKQLESVETLHVPIPSAQSNLNVHMKKTKTLCERQLELIEKQKNETLYADMEEEKGDFRKSGENYWALLYEKKELIERDVQQAEDGLQKNILRDITYSKSIKEKDSKNASDMAMDRSSEDKKICESNERLSTWLSFMHLDPLLPYLSRPTFLDTGISELSKQHGSDDYMDNLFGPLSPSISSRRTSMSSTEGYIVAQNKTSSRPEMCDTADAVLTAEDMSFLTESLSLPPVPENSTNFPATVSTVSTSSAFENSNSLCYVPTSTMKAVAVIHDKQANSESVQNLKTSDENKKILFAEANVATVRQISRSTITTDSKYIMPLRSQRKRSGSNPQNKDETLGIRVDSPKLPKKIAKSIDTEEDELEKNPGSIIQQSGSAKAVSERIVFSEKRYLEKKENLVRLSEDKVKSVLEIVRDKSADLRTFQEEQKFGKCFGNPTLQKQSLRRSAKRKHVRTDSCSSEDNQELVIDAKELNNVQSELAAEVALTQQENVNERLDKTSGDPILNDNSAKFSSSEKEVLDSSVSWKKLDEKGSLKDNRKNSKKYWIPSTTKSGSEVADEKQSNTQLSASLVQRKILRNELENTEIAVESSSKNVQVREPKKLAAIQNNRQIASEVRKRKLTEKGASNAEDKCEDADQTTILPNESTMTEIHHGKEPVNEDSGNMNKSMTSNMKLLGIELSHLDDDDDDNRLEIITDDAETSSLNTENGSGESCVLNNCSGSEKAKTAAIVTKKSINIAKSEMYKKMRKRLAIQTSCMKELGRVQVHKLAKKKIISTLSKSKEVERKPNIIQRKKAAIMLPAGSSNGLKKDKNVGLPTIQHGAVRIGKLLTKIPVGSDEAAVMCLFDQALSESNYDDKLLEIVQKFQNPAISAISCEKLAEYCVKFINKLDVGNMWHSVVLAVRYWSDKQKDRCTSGKVLELHQVASSKERNFIEVLHQLSGEECWNNIISFFLRKMIISMMKTRPVSVAQHGLNIRCVLLCTRILLQDDSNNEMLISVRNLLQHLIERDSSDRVVPMICYSIAIVPEIVDKLLLEENEQFEPVRRVMSLHLASRDELFAIFSKVIMSRLLNKSTYSATCLQKVNIDSFHGWFAESINMIVTSISSLDLESMELNPRFLSAMTTCNALFCLATNRLVPNKETLVFPVLNECIRIISGYLESKEKDVISFKERNEMFADTTGLQSLSDTLIKTILRLLLFGRLMISFVRSTECSILPRVANLTEEIHRFREFARIKLEQEGETVANRLLYFGLNDWLRVMKPWTKYLQAAFTVEKSD